MRYDRFLDSIEFMRKDVIPLVARERFYMLSWCYGTQPLSFDADCQTKACFMGFLTLRFPDELQISRYGGLQHVPTGLSGIDAAAEFFDITEDEAKYLFAPEGIQRYSSPTPTAEEVIARIEEFLRTREIPWREEDTQ